MRRYRRSHHRPYHRPHYVINYRFKIGIIFIIVGLAFLILSFLIGKLNASLNDRIIFAFIGLLITGIGIVIVNPGGRRRTNVVNINQR